MSIRKKITLIKVCIVFLCAWLIVGSLNATGFCVSEGRYLSDRELLERYVVSSRFFKVDTSSLTAAQAKEINFPDCCRIYSVPSYSSVTGAYVLPFFGAARVYGVNAYFLDKEKLNQGAAEPAKEIFSDIDSCGKRVDREPFSMSTTVHYYQSLTSSIHKHYSGEKF